MIMDPPEEERIESQIVPVEKVFPFPNCIDIDSFSPQSAHQQRQQYPPLPHVELLAVPRP